MKLLNQHERRVAHPPRAVFAELEALGTVHDRIWPAPRMPLRRSAGPMQVGVTRERHGVIRAVLEDYREHERIVWRVDLKFLRGTHAFEVQDLGGGESLARHVVRAELPWWFVPVWRLYIGPFHDRLLEALLDRLERVLAAPARASG